MISWRTEVAISGRLCILVEYNWRSRAESCSNLSQRLLAYVLEGISPLLSHASLTFAPELTYTVSKSGFPYTETSYLHVFSSSSLIETQSFRQAAVSALAMCSPVLLKHLEMNGNAQYYSGNLA